MVKTVEELQNLIEWAKKTRVKSLKMGEIEVVMSDYAFIEQLTEGAEQAPIPDLATASKTPDWTSGDPKIDKADEEEELFWSTR